jgi:branched-chain amino acid transport system permease protein
MIATTILMLVLLYLFFRHTRIGLAMRAAAANPESARLAGIRVGWMNALGWGMAAAIGSVAGMLIAPVVFLEPNMMLSILLYGFAGAVVGGLTSPGGAVLGGFAVGVIENLAGTYIPGGRPRDEAFHRALHHRRGAVREAERLVRPAGRDQGMTMHGPRQ